MFPFAVFDNPTICPLSSTPRTTLLLEPAPPRVPRSPIVPPVDEKA